MSNKLYYLEPEFKYQSLIVPFIITIPILFIIYHIVKGDTENFQNKDLEYDIINKYEKKETEIDNYDNDNIWDITEYIHERYIELKKYIIRLSMINNDNGNKSINVRYNIE